MIPYFKRPGLSHGNYPERHSPNNKKKVKAALKEAKRFVIQVNAYKKTNQDLNDKQLQKNLDFLRIQLRSQGLVPDLVVKSFALIREFSFRRLSMQHYDEQLISGWALINGMLAEMQTGEGKTLSATLAAGTAGLAGIPTHIMTVNDYLVTRDAAKMGPLYKQLGLSLGIITENTNEKARINAYAKDITYGTATQIAFDCMRDTLLIGKHHPLHLQMDAWYNESPIQKKLRLRGLCYAIVDEADSVFIDEARTPLVISTTTKTKNQARMYDAAIKLAGKLDGPQDFIIDIKSKKVRLTTRGKNKLIKLSWKKEGGVLNSKNKDELIQQALSALYLFVKDKHYLVKDNKIQIIDEHTGRLMPDRSWQQGLHQLLETKEALPLTDHKEPLAQLSFQRFFTRYLLLSGMTGTAREVRSELKQVYNLKVITVPTHKPAIRKDMGYTIHVNTEEKYKTILDTVRTFYKKGNPVLLGTRSVEESEKISLLLSEHNIKHQTLSARQDRQEAEKIAQAGESGFVTVATNMAGRGTDILLSDKARTLGGLHVIIVDQNESARVDRQLTGRCGRQGDPGSYQFIISLDDDIFTQSYSAPLLKCLSMLANKQSLIPSWLGSYLIHKAQHKLEKQQQAMRKQLLKQDNKREKMLSFSRSKYTHGN